MNELTGDLSEAQPSTSETAYSLAAGTDSWTALERDLDRTEWMYTRGERLREAAIVARESGEVEVADKLDAVGALFQFMLQTRRGRGNRGHGRFAPFVEWSGGRAYPHVDRFPPETISMFYELALHAANPIHQSILADFVWDQRARYPRERRDTATAARIAVQAYLNAARLFLSNGWNDQTADALDRATEIALQLKDEALVDTCRELCLETARTLVKSSRHPDVRWAIDVIVTIVTSPRMPSENGSDEAVALCEAGASFYKSTGAHHLERSYLKLLAEVQRWRGTPASANEALKRRADSFLREAQDADSAVVRLVVLQDAAEAYADLGDGDQVDAIKQQLAQAGIDSRGEMKTISVRATIPKEIAEAWVSQLTDMPLPDALDALASTRRFIPGVHEIRNQAAENRTNFPIQHLITQRKLDLAGRIVAAPVSDEETIAASEIEAFHTAVGFSDVELGLAFTQLEEKRGLTAEALAQHLAGSGMFEEGTLDMIHVGVQRYFSADYVSALHILVPHLENALRAILPKIGVSRTSLQQGTTREKPLDVVLETPKLQAVLGEDLAYFLQQYLTNPASENLRNRAAHGLLVLADCNRVRAQRVLLCFLHLANLSLPTPGEDNQQPT